MIDPKYLKKLKTKKHKGPGRPIAFSDELILILLMIKIHFKLPYRMLEGFTKYILNGINGKGRPRKWIKLYLAIDAKTQEIIAELTTDSATADPTTFPVVFAQINYLVKEVIADGAYDSGDIRNLIKQQRGRALIPPLKNVVCNGIDVDRDQAVLDIHAFEGNKISRSIWGKLTGYSRRSIVETTLFRYKKMFGEKAFSGTREHVF